MCAAGIAGVLVRPRRIPEWVWAVAAATALTLTGLVPFHTAGAAIASGSDVYLFLGGMMLLAELARRGGVFVWLAALAVRAARGSRFRLFALVYVVGIVVTVVLSNDATAVVLTPAVAAVVRDAKGEPLPYLLACAFIANAASFVLPISNPANLVVFRGAVPALAHWLAAFALPSLCSIVSTFVVLAFVSRRSLRGTVVSDVAHPVLAADGRLALGGIGFAAVALIAASTFAAPLGVTTFACGIVVLAISCIREPGTFAPVVRSVSWSVLLLVAGLFVMVGALERTGLLAMTRGVAERIAAWPAPFDVLGAAGLTTLASNLINNLPAGLIAGSTVAGMHAHVALRSAVAIGIDLGPNLSVTGSLATILWLIALRRDGMQVTAWTFLRAGALVMPPALILAVLAAARV